MNKLTIDLENCFGIGKLVHEFDYLTHNSNTAVIYAPNGTMKTSFARTFDLVSKGDPKNLPCDRVHSHRVSKFEITADANPINPKDILVINAEDNGFDASNKISNFLASKELKAQYDKIYSELENLKSEYLKKLKIVAQSSDCEGEIVNSFSDTSAKNFFEIISKESENLNSPITKYTFKYNDVFDKKNAVRKFLDTNQKLLNQYVTDYTNLLSKSKFFKQSNNSFGTYQANEILRSIEDNSFFDAGHKFLLEDGTEVNNSEDLKSIVQEEIAKILSDEKLQKGFEKIDKAIGSNAELRTFKKVIEKDHLILVELKDYDVFQKKVWHSYMFELKDETDDLANEYSKRKTDLEKIISEAKKEFLLWGTIVNTFNSRFIVPFKVILANQEDIILKQETANLEFEYLEHNEDPVKQKKENLLNILSKGEQRAYFILQFLFEIESRKNAQSSQLIVFDDVADSFDYKNKFAVLEYIRDLHNSENFKLLVLTHNFDFYRTIASRLYLPHEIVYMATKTDDKTVTLHAGQYRNDIFPYFIKNLSNPRFFISLIAFVRNIVEYTDSKKSQDYMTLTSCLHLKSDSQSFLAGDIFNIYTARITNAKGKVITFSNEKLVDLIYKTADEICAEININEIELQNKITLAIAVRLKSEKYLIEKLPEIDLSMIDTNQTNKLFQAYKTKYSNSPAIKVLDKVNLMTPENIHVNAFMFEPLIDMSINHLKSLYSQASALN
nr:hypothetical protein [uncultured Flavobacterium sp.]